VRKKRKSVCIITFSPIARDARVLRQIEYLAPHYDLTVIGPGERYQSFVRAGVRWSPILAVRLDRSLRRLIEKVTGLSLLVAGRLCGPSFERWFWRQPIMNDTLAKAIATGADAFHANDWNALPVAAEAAKQLKARVVFDAHEYAPLEFENRRVWRLVYAPMIEHMLRRYAPAVDASITVAPAIAERYRREFQMDMSVVLNAPVPRDRSSEKETDFENVRLIHHGAAIPDRRLEVMVEALAQCHRRFKLHFMLTALGNTYVNRLKKLADQRVPGRVFFHEPVTPEEVVNRISDYDIGFCYIAPTNYNYLVSLPNKFFDFIAAGLPVCIGPSPSMAEIVETYGLGCVARSFGATDIAAVLNSLSAEQLVTMRRGARAAAGEINAEREMNKLVKIYESLLPEG